MLQRAITKNAIFLMLFALVTTLTIALVFVLTKSDIANNEHQRLLSTLNTLVPQNLYDNELVKDCIQIQQPDLLGTSEKMNVYRARLQGAPVALILNAVAPDGYNGRIDLLVAVDASGKLLGIRSPKHKETPGLGDKIDVEKSQWVYQFNGKSLQVPELTEWKVKKDGGVFDQLTGATITPRAIVKAVKKSLQLYAEQSELLWQTTTEQVCE